MMITNSRHHIDIRDETGIIQELELDHSPKVRLTMKSSIQRVVLIPREQRRSSYTLFYIFILQYLSFYTNLIREKNVKTENQGSNSIPKRKTKVKKEGNQKKLPKITQINPMKHGIDSSLQQFY